MLNRRNIIRAVLPILGISIAACTFTTSDSEGGGIEFAISFSERIGNEPLDGRIILLLSTDNSAEPRFQTGGGAGAIGVFGLDVEDLAPGEDAILDSSVFGYPVESLNELPRPPAISIPRPGGSRSIPPGRFVTPSRWMK